MEQIIDISMYVPVVLAVLVIGTLIVTCFRVLSLQRSLSKSRPTKNEISSTPTVAWNHSTVAPLHIPILSPSGTQKQSTAALISSTPTVSTNHSTLSPSGTHKQSAAALISSTPTVTTNHSTLSPPGSQKQSPAALISSTPTVTTNHSTLIPSGSQKQSAAASNNASLTHNSSILHCTPPFSNSSSSSSSLLKPRHIFVDFGANDGNSVSSFIWGVSSGNFRLKLNPEERALVDGSQNVTKANYTDWEAHVFEANPRYTKALVNQQREFFVRNTTRSYTLYESTAIMTYDGTTQFILDNNYTGDAGSTTVAESRSAVGKRINVTAIDILTFFRKLHIRPNDHVIVKMDVEGAEYALVQRMITHCVFPLIDKIAIEWHHQALWVFGSPIPRWSKGETAPLPHERNERQNITHRYWLEYERLKKSIDEHGWTNKLLTWG